MNDTFPYTKEIPFKAITLLQGEYIQIQPPSNWKNPLDYFGYFASGDSFLHIYFLDEKNTSFRIAFAPSSNFFINFKDQKIFAFQNTRDPEQHNPY